MIRRTPSGYVVYSEKGKKLSRAYKSKGAAVKRLAQIEFFRDRDKKKGK